MRKVHRLVAGSVGAAAIAIVACGGSSANPPGGPGGVDSGAADVTTNVDSAAAADSSPITDAAVACVPDASLNGINVADAALNDAGASTGACLGCSQTSCGTEITACDKDCVCNSAVSCVYKNCLGSLGSQLAIAQCAIGHACVDPNAPNFGITPAITALITCLTTSCTSQCNLNLDAGTVVTEAGADTGTPDASHDAAHD